MRFGLGLTPQNSIAGWLAPDNPTKVPRFRVDTEAVSRVFYADCYRPDIRDAGYHETGLVGFNFAEHNVPGITTAQEVTVVELLQNKVIFRKTSKPYINRKLFILNNLPVPLQQFKRGFGEQFLTSYPGIEELGAETTTALLGNGAINSIFAEGRLAITPNIQMLKEAGFHLSALIVDPYVELANRLLAVKAMIDAGKEAVISRLSQHYSELLNPVKQVKSLTDDIDELLGNLLPPERAVISNPLTQLLACLPGEDPEPRHVPLALETLAQFDSVGIVTNMALYRDTIADSLPRLNIPDNIFQELRGSSEVEVALRSSSRAAKALVNDARLYSYISRTMNYISSDQLDDR